MSVVSLLNVQVKNNPTAFNAPYEFEITFECLEQLQKDLEWKLTYVGSATSNEHDQELDSLLVGPIPVGINKFQFEADPPDLSRIPNSEILGVTVILLSCAYDGREFVRVGYYVNNEYTDEALQLEPPSKPVIDKVRRNILADKPRVTRFAIKWDSDESAPPEFPPDQPEADLGAADGDQYGLEEEEEEEEPEAVAEGAPAESEDADMAGAEDTAGPVAEEDAASDAGSEEIDIEESEGEDEEEEEAEGGDDDMDMDEAEPSAEQKQSQQAPQQHSADVMVH